MKSKEKKEYEEKISLYYPYPLLIWYMKNKLLSDSQVKIVD